MKDKVFISLMTDFGFKRVFGSEPNKVFLVSLLNCILLYTDDIEIVDIEYLKNEYLSDDEEDRKVIIDLMCKDTQNRLFVVEVQLSPQLFFTDRILYYASRIFSNQQTKGNWNYELKPLYIISLSYFTIQNDFEVISVQKLMNIKTQEVFSDKLTIINVQLNNFKKNEEELETDLEKWLYLLKDIHKLERIPKNFQGYLFERLFQIAEYHGLSKKEREKYDKKLDDMGVYENAIQYAILEGKKLAEKEIQEAREKEREAREKEKEAREKEKEAREKEKEAREKEKEAREKEREAREKIVLAILNLRKLKFSDIQIQEVLNIKISDYHQSIF